MKSGEGNESEDQDHGEEEHKTNVDVFQDRQSWALRGVVFTVCVRRTASKAIRNRLRAPDALHEDKVKSKRKEKQK